MGGYRDFTYNELAEDIGTATGDAFRNAANAAANLVCEIQEQNTRWLIGAGDPLGFGSAAAGLYDSLCRPRGKPFPTLPPPPITGGQCAVAYRVEAQTQEPNCSFGSYSSRGTFQGPITNVSFSEGARQPTGGPNGEFSGSAGIQFTDGTGTQRNLGVGTFGNNSCQGKTANWRVVRVDGLPDNCGNAPTEYPDTTPTPTDLEDDADIVITPDITVNVPVIIVEPPEPPDIVVNVGPFTVQFDLGGINVSINPSINFGPRTDPRTDPPANPNTPNPDQPGGNECDLDEVLTKLNALLDCDRCDQERTYKSQVYEETDSAILALPSRCYAVSVEITTIPERRDEFTGRNAPDVLMKAGWGWFGVAPYYEQREPIDTIGKLFVWKREDIFPDTFAFTLTQGYVGKVRALYYDLPEG